MTDEQIEQFYHLLEHAQPDNWKAQYIMDIVEEELIPYFDNTISAKEAVRKLDNRVQLFLDESK